MTVDPLGILAVLSGCLLLGGFVSFMLQPLLGWQGSARWAGWGSVLVLAVAVGVRV